MRAVWVLALCCLLGSGSAAALGLAGDPESVAPLLKLATDESAHVLARAYACVALGHLAQRVGPAWDVRLVEAGAGRNVHARTPAIAEVLDIR